MSDRQGNLFIADNKPSAQPGAFQCTLREIQAQTAQMIALAGYGVGSGLDSEGGKIGFCGGIASDAAGNVYVSDTSNGVIRKWSTDARTFTRFAGGGSVVDPADGIQALNAQIPSPTALAASVTGELFVAEYYRIRVIRRDGTIWSYAGTGQPGFSGDGGKANKAQIRQPGSLAFDPVGNLLIADTGNGKVRRIDSDTGIISTVASGDLYISGDAQRDGVLGRPLSLAVGADGTVYIADGLVRRLNSDGQVIWVAGKPFLGASDAERQAQHGVVPVEEAVMDAQVVAILPNGNVDLYDAWAHLLREIVIN